MATRVHRYCSDQAYASILTWRTKVLAGVIDPSDLRDDPSAYATPTDSPGFGAIDIPETGGFVHRSVSEVAQEETRERAAQRKTKAGGGGVSSSRIGNHDGDKRMQETAQVASAITRPDPIYRPPAPSPLVPAHPRGLPHRTPGNIVKPTTNPYERATPQISPLKRAREDDFDSDRPDSRSPNKTYDSPADYDKTMVNPMYSSPGTVKRVRLRLSPPRTNPGTIEGPLDSPTTLPSRGTTIMPSSSGSKLRQDGAFYQMYDKFISGKGI